MRHQRPRDYFGPPPMRCSCCGVEEMQGCVIGYPCSCTWEYCNICGKCTKHCPFSAILADKEAEDDLPAMMYGEVAPFD